MSSSIPREYSQATVTTKANVYFDGKVVSHALVLPNGEKKTLGLVYPGSFHFTTRVPERMDITSGTARIKLEGEMEFKVVEAGEGFDVPANSAFDIAVDGGIAEYVCSYR